MRQHFTCICLSALLLAGCQKQRSSTADSTKSVAIFAAASTKEAVERIARDFHGETGSVVDITLGPSSGLAKQIEQGAPADLFLSADEASADFLAGKKLVSSRRDLLGNRLVAIIPTQ